MINEGKVININFSKFSGKVPHSQLAWKARSDVIQGSGRRSNKMMVEGCYSNWMLVTSGDHRDRYKVHYCVSFND